jgi:MbtH protein
VDETEDTRRYKVVVNHEEQYSIWFAEREPPLGWKEVGKSGPKAECLAYIKEVWTDMRPLSLRNATEEAEKKPTARVANDARSTNFEARQTGAPLSSQPLRHWR